MTNSWTTAWLRSKPAKRKGKYDAVAMVKKLGARVVCESDWILYRFRFSRFYAANRERRV